MADPRLPKHPGQGDAGPVRIEPKLPRAAGRAEEDAWYAGLRDRLRQVAGNTHYSEIAHKTGTHPETVRRYLTRGTPCVRFVARFCEAFGVDREWLLSDRATGAANADQPASSDQDTTMRVQIELRGPDGHVRVFAAALAGERPSGTPSATGPV